MADRFEVSINSSGDFLVWNPDSVEILRENCRIFGRCIGSVARAPHKSALKGMPIKLGFEELVTLLKENAEKFDLVVCRSVVSESVAKPSEEVLSGYRAAMERNYREMSEIIRTERRKKTELHFANDDGNVPHKKQKIDTEDAPEIRVESVFVHLPTGTPVEWLRAGEHELIESSKSASLADSIQFLCSLLQNRFGIHTPLDTVIRCAVFHRLWTRGHRVTISAKKMGGDFLIYPDDPWVCHASHVVRLSSRKWRPCELISAVRLANSLKKNLLVASYELGSPATAASLSTSENGFNVGPILESLKISFNSFKWCGNLP